jgi:hypothetical protein
VTWVRRGDLGTAVPYNVHHAEGQSDAITVNQQVAPPGSVPDDPLPWQSLGVYEAAQSVEVNGHNPSPYPRTCVDAVLLRGIDPICDLLTDSNNDGSINADDDPIEGDPNGGEFAGPGRIVAIGSSTRTEVKLHAAAVDANLSCPQHWWAQLRFPSGLKVWENPVGAPELTTNTTREITANAPWDTSVWIEGVTAGTASLQLELFSHPGDPEEERSYCWKDAVKFSVVDAHVNLEAKTILHNQPNGVLSESQEDYPGAFVPVNNDDDDYDAQNLEDRLQARPVAGEDDFLPLVLHQVEPSSEGGWYRLHVPTNMRLWLDYNGQMIRMRDLATLRANTGDRNLYVEGYSLGAGILYVDWYSPNQARWVNCADSVSITAFFWDPPLNVPDYSKHVYVATLGAAGEGMSTWLAPDGGVVANKVDDFVLSDGSVWDGMTIKWESPYPDYGKAVYQAPPRLHLGRESQCRAGHD